MGQSVRQVLLFPVDRDTPKFFATSRVTFLMPRVCFKPTKGSIEMHHVRTFVSVWRHDFFVLLYVMLIHNVFSSRGKFTLLFVCHRIELSA